MARRLNDISDFEPADVNSALRRQQLHSGAQAEPDQHGSLDGVGADGEGTDWEEQSIGLNGLSEDSDDDARNIRNWVDGVEDGLDVIGMDDAHDSAIDMPGSDDDDDGGADDLDEEERERMVEYMEMFKLYRNIGRRCGNTSNTSWPHFTISISRMEIPMVGKSASTSTYQFGRSVRWKGVNGVYSVLCVDGVHGVIYIQKKPFSPMWQ